MSITNQLAKITFRIEVDLQDGGTSTGTAFLYSIHKDENSNTSSPLLITNKHVVANGIAGRIIISYKDASDNIIHHPVNLENFQTLWRDHPDQNIDITSMIFAPYVHPILNSGNQVELKAFHSSDIMSEAELQRLNTVEDILMVGYPNGLWDSHNNQPLFRKGITSTHPSLDFEGRKEFVIDIAAFPGSSGSPVVLFSENGYLNDNSIVMGGRMKLLGVLYAGPVYSVQGEIVVETIPNRNVPLALTAIPMNLGYAINARVLLDFEDLYERGEILN